MTRRPARDRTRSPQGRLRIVAGNWRSRVLAIADVEGLRPTPERVRETLFNWLQPRIHGARCLDLFAGTGALGLEALSRGASAAVFVEKSPAAAATLRRNVELLGASGATVVEADALQWLKSADARFDIVFLDPPFAAELLTDLCRLVAERDLLAEDARVYLEMGRDQAMPTLPGGWQVLKDKTAGQVRYLLVTPGA